MTIRVEDYSHAYNSVIVSVDWENGHDAAISFTQLLLSHGMEKPEVTKQMQKAVADIEAGANMVEVATDDNHTVSINILSKLGQSEPEGQ